MKYIITEGQQKRMIKHISDILNYEFEKTKIVCGVTVEEFGEDDEGYNDGLRYYIFVSFNEKYTRTAGIFGFRIATERKIREMLRNWFGLEKDEYFISTLVKDC
jgi:hypothetical protein